MYTVIPLEKVDRETVISMAESAADNGLPPSANPFPESDPNHNVWLRAFHERDMALAGVD